MLLLPIECSDHDRCNNQKTAKDSWDHNCILWETLCLWNSTRFTFISQSTTVNILTCTFNIRPMLYLCIIQRLDFQISLNGLEAKGPEKRDSFKQESLSFQLSNHDFNYWNLKFTTCLIIYSIILIYSNFKSRFKRAPLKYVFNNSNISNITL